MQESTTPSQYLQQKFHLRFDIMAKNQAKKIKQLEKKQQISEIERSMRESVAIAQQEVNLV